MYGIMHNLHSEKRYATDFNQVSTKWTECKKSYAIDFNQVKYQMNWVWSTSFQYQAWIQLLETKLFLDFRTHSQRECIYMYFRLNLLDLKWIGGASVSETYV